LFFVLSLHDASSLFLSFSLTFILILILILRCVVFMGHVFLSWQFDYKWMHWTHCWSIWFGGCSSLTNNFGSSFGVDLR
jgi:hypothetical protein